MTEFDPASLRKAITAYEQAVALDSAFIRAWSRLAEAQSGLYFTGTPTPTGAEEARRAAVRALALDRSRPEGHRALASYYRDVLRDHRRAYTEDSIALALAPGSSEVLGAVAWDEVSLGRWDAAREHFEQAVRLDPRSVFPADGLALVLLYTRHHREAEQAYRRLLQVSPANLNPRFSLAAVALAQGDLSAAQAVLRTAPKEVDPTALVAYVAYYWDLYWVLDDAQQRLVLRLTPSAFGDDRGSWGLVLAEIYDLQGNRVKARAYADSARVAYEQQLQATPEDALRRVCLGTALAYLGRKVEAVREGKHGVRLLPISRDAWIGPYIQHQLVRIYLMVGEPEKALDHLEPLLKLPYHLSPGWLKIDPTFDPLRGNPRFQRLVNGA